MKLLVVPRYRHDFQRGFPITEKRPNLWRIQALIFPCYISPHDLVIPNMRVSDFEAVRIAVFLKSGNIGSATSKSTTADGVSMGVHSL